jgi:alpha-glucosidase
MGAKTRPGLTITLAVVGALAIAVSAAAPTDAKQACPPTQTDAPSVGAPPATYPPFYRKYLDANGVAILGDAAVCDRSLQLAYLIVTHMLSKRPDIQQTLAARGAHVAIYSENNTILSVPEFASRAATVKNDRCGVTGLPGNPTTAVCETNLIGIHDPFNHRASQLIHEMGHLIMNFGVDRATRDAILRAYTHARDQRLFPPNQANPPSYAMSTPGEFFAMATMAWFSAANWSAPFNSVHEKDRAAQAAHDPELDALLRGLYPDDDWRYPRG